MKVNRLFRGVKTYAGPDVNSLDPALQKALIDYFSELGINDEMANFIDAMSLDRDQQLYMKWLKDSKEFFA